jgi:hypothetical protein
MKDEHELELSRIEADIRAFRVRLNEVGGEGYKKYLTNAIVFLEKQREEYKVFIELSR